MHHADPLNALFVAIAALGRRIDTSKGLAKATFIGSSAVAIPVGMAKINTSNTKT